MKLENEARDGGQASADRLKLRTTGSHAAGAAADRRLENETACNGGEGKRSPEVDSAAAASAEADRLKRENDGAKSRPPGRLDRAAKEKAQLEAEKAELRIQLLKQFNAILQTRDTARG